MSRVFAAAAVFAISTISAAQAAGMAPKGIAVAYGDLDLSAASGQSELKVHLQEAAAKLCSPVLVPPDSEPTAQYHMSVYHACIGRLSERAMAKVKTGRN